ncbi:CidA/LrgA family protein [Oceanobacillus sp. CAU 1775]
MKLFKGILHIAFLFGLLYIGNWIQASLSLSIPGSVIGMLLLFALLKFGIIKLDWIKEGTQFILRNLTLFFIPVTIGFIEYLELFSGSGLYLLLIAIISTGIVMGVSGFVSQKLAKGKDVQHE